MSVAEQDGRAVNAHGGGNGDLLPSVTNKSVGCLIGGWSKSGQDKPMLLLGFDLEGSDLSSPRRDRRDDDKDGGG